MVHQMRGWPFGHTRLLFPSNVLLVRLASGCVLAASGEYTTLRTVQMFPESLVLFEET